MIRNVDVYSKKIALNTEKLKKKRWDAERPTVTQLFFKYE